MPLEGFVYRRIIAVHENVGAMETESAERQRRLTKQRSRIFLMSEEMVPATTQEKVLSNDKKDQFIRLLMKYSNGSYQTGSRRRRRGNCLKRSGAYFSNSIGLTLGLVTYYSSVPMPFVLPTI